MKIMAPLKGLEHIEPLIAAKPDEVYFGFIDDEWQSEFGCYEELNRMSSFGNAANIDSVSNAIIAAKRLVESGTECFLTLNTAQYSGEQLSYLRKIIDTFSDIGCGFIVGDLNAAKYCIDIGAKCAVSTMAGIYNSESVKWLSNIGIKRVILPRDISLTDIEAIVNNNPQIEFEAFLMRNGCRYSDSNCMSFHAGNHNSLCFYLDCSKTEAYIAKPEDKYNFYNNHSLYKNVFHKEACGLCAIYRMLKIGIASLKIVGRANHPLEMQDDIRLVKENILIAEGCNSEREYLANIIIPPQFMERCLYGMNCYYPEIRFN